MNPKLKLSAGPWFLVMVLVGCSETCLASVAADEAIMQRQIDLPARTERIVASSGGSGSEMTISEGSGIQAQTGLPSSAGSSKTSSGASATRAHPRSESTFGQISSSSDFANKAGPDDQAAAPILFDYTELRGNGSIYGAAWTPSNVFVFPPVKTFAELATPLVTPLLALTLGWGFSIFMFNHSRKIQREDKQSDRRDELSDEFWFRKTIFPMFQHRIKSYCERADKKWCELTTEDLTTAKLQHYLEFDAQAEHHNLLFMIEEIKNSIPEIITDDVERQLVELFDEVEGVYMRDFPKLTEGAALDEIDKYKQKFRHEISTVEYRALAILHNSHRKYVSELASN